MLERDVAILLCRVETAGNVGSICRAMKTMGVKSLVLVNCPDYNETELRKMAVHAFEVYENAIRVDSLDKALDNFSLSAGFTRRLGARRKSASLEARSFAEMCESRDAGKIALVFGNEKDGLSDDELQTCDMSVHIPSSDEFPSLNVAHAVQIACYEFFIADRAQKTRTAPAVAPIYSPVTRRNAGNDIEKLMISLSEIGFFTKSDSSYTSRFLRDMVERAFLVPEEFNYLMSLFKKAVMLGAGKGMPRRKIKSGEPISKLC
jgi:TrmH family RNA methyltransferase